ncbi:hypothetical protein EGW08_006878 [Elysia chlorotica]|uniref:C-type lectin domain-containing protein n=1 Tax=Elysia chlorotica TaxID=188477 RepID=A0A3S1BCU6_ELYCH|nr:hypothetical protein EGW08_006878 [Elysia chlorotica]
MCRSMFWNQTNDAQQIDAGGSDLYLFKNPCRLGYSAYQVDNTTSCLKLSTKRSTYRKARSDCQADGGHTASTKTPEKLALLVKLAQGVYFWVGMDDRKKNKEFVWQDDGSVLTPLQTQQLFMPGEPSHLTDQDCVSVKAPETGLNDRKCNLFMNSFCEIQPGC